MRAALLVLLAACPAPQGVRAGSVPPTVAEQSHYERTGRYDEVIAQCHAFEAAYDRVTCRTFNYTAENRPIVAIDIHRGDALPTIYMEAGIHAGEIEGKDAGFAFLRDLLDGKVAPHALDKVRVVFVPVINPDGHERFAPNNRPNQRGPAEMGFRTNGQRLNINRDFMKADSAETYAVMRALIEAPPVVFVDLHTTDGAKFEYDIAIDAAPIAPRTDHFEEAAQLLSKEITQRLTALGHLPIDQFYPSFQKVDDPLSGFALGEAPPRFSQVYVGLRNIIGILVETHSWKTYPQRVKANYDFMQALFELAATESQSWVTAQTKANWAALELGGKDLPVAFDNGPHTTTLDFRGYAYTQTPSEISGAPWIVYDEKTPQIWKLPLKDEIVAKTTVHVPQAGYVIDGGYAALVRGKLSSHNIKYDVVKDGTQISAKVFRATSVKLDAATYENRTRVTLQGAWTPELRTLDKDAIFIPIRQNNARVIVNLLDPMAPDSLAQWGFFNTAFESKEYMEEYVTEQLARDMIAAHPELKTEFDAAVAADPEFAKSSAKRLEWWYRKTPAWDERMNLLPVYQVDKAPTP